MEHLEFELAGGKQDPKAGISYVIAGVVASGNLEVMAEPQDLDGRCRLVVNTRCGGFCETWKAVFEDFINRSQARNVLFSINDFSATPPLVSLRLDQAWEQLNR